MSGVHARRDPARRGDLRRCHTLHLADRRWPAPAQDPLAHGTPLDESINPRLNCVAVTPDGRRIMSAGQTAKRREETKLRGRHSHVAMSEVRFWDVASGERIADYHGDEDYGFGYGALSRDGRRVAVADHNRLRILDAATGWTERTIELPGSSGGRPAFSPDGRLVAMPIANAISLFEVSTGRRLHHDESTPVGYVASAAWSPSGDRLAVGQFDGLVRVWDGATGKLIWHKPLAPVVSPIGRNPRAASVCFSRDGKLVVAAGIRDDPVTEDHGIVVFYEADSGRTVREVPQKAIRSAAMAPDGRIVVIATSDGAYGDTHFLGIEVGTGRTRWSIPPRDQRVGFPPVARMQFAGNTPWFQAALRGGDVIRFSALTGHEQRRFLAEWRTPEEQKAGQPRKPDMWEATFSADGRTLVSCQMEWVYVWDVESGLMRRKFRHPHRHGCHLGSPPAVAPWRPRTSGTATISARTRSASMTSRLVGSTSRSNLLTTGPTCWRSHPTAPSSSPDSTGAAPSSGTCAEG